MQLHKEYQEQSLTFKDGEITWRRPTTLKELQDLTRCPQSYRIVAGHTDVGKCIFSRIENQTEILQRQSKQIPTNRK